MKAIVSVMEDGAIGHKGQMLMENPEDLKRFASLTRNSIVIMGRKTQQSLPGGKPLPDRKNLVLTRKRDLQLEGFTVCHDKEEVLDACNRAMNSGAWKGVWIIGGAQVYREFLDLCSQCHVTRHLATKEADTYFPDLERLPRWQLTGTQDGGRTEDGCPFRYEVWENKGFPDLQE